MCLLCCTSIGRGGTHEDGIAVLQNQPVHWGEVHTQSWLNTTSEFIESDPAFRQIRIRNPGQPFLKRGIFLFQCCGTGTGGNITFCLGGTKTIFTYGSGSHIN